MKNLRSMAFLFVLFAVVSAPRVEASSSPMLPVATLLPVSSAGGAIPAEQILPEYLGMAATSLAENARSPQGADVLTTAQAKAGEEKPESADPMESRNNQKAKGKQGSKNSNNMESDYVPEEGEEEPATIADPLEPFNRAMYHFNDKLYFWLLKPVAQAYGDVVPEPARISVENFFTNLLFPIRFLSCLLQADFPGAAKESGRFAVNTLWGVGGLLDPSSPGELDIPRQNVDLGQTLGVYGVGPGFYIVWPFLGPSSLRDTVDIPARHFLSPFTYVNPWYTSSLVRGYEEVNETSLRIGDYEALKGAAIDPYLAIRDAYVQYRKKKIEGRKGKIEQSPAGEEEKP